MRRTLKCLGAQCNDEDFVASNGLIQSLSKALNLFPTTLLGYAPKEQQGVPQKWLLGLGKGVE